MYFLMASLSMFFVTALIAMFSSWESSIEWRTEGSPGLPGGLAAASATIFAQAWVLHLAWRAIKENRDRGFVRLLTLAIFLGLLFLGFQLANWQRIEMALRPGLDDELYVFYFLLLTGIHAAQVFFGFPPLLVVLYRAGQHEYTSSHCEPVKLCIQYWYYLAAVWLVLLACLVIVTYA